MCIYIYIHHFTNLTQDDIRTFGIVTPTNDHSSDVAVRSL